MAKLERNIVAGTDGASFFLFHPEDLKHRKDSEPDWIWDDGATEYAAANLVGFDTGGDGGFSFRITEGDLTDQERQRLVCSWDFPYIVRHNRVFLDGGDNLPSLDQLADPLDTGNARLKDKWIDLPNGNYRVTVHAVRAWTDDTRQAIEGLTSYVIRFQPIADIRSVEPAKGQVMLFHDKGWKAAVRES
jgi:Family of unknown function (DUF6386)